MFFWQTPKLKGGKVRCSLANTLDMGRDAQQGVVCWWTPQGNEGGDRGLSKEIKGKGNLYLMNVQLKIVMFINEQLKIVVFMGGTTKDK